MAASSDDDVTSITFGELKTRLADACRETDMVLAKRAALQAVYDAHVAEKFLDALFVISQHDGGAWAQDIRQCAFICRATRDEEMLWSSMSRVGCGPRRRTHLMYAAKADNDQDIRWLIKHGADLEQRDVTGKSALYWAVRFDCKVAVRCLQQAGARMTGIDANGNDAVMIAAFRGCSSVLRYLLTGPSKLNARNNNGDTALHLASQQHELATMRILLQNGASNVRTNLMGKTPRQLFVAASHKAIAVKIFGK